jgi:hypothetical protein
MVLVCVQLYLETFSEGSYLSLYSVCQNSCLFPVDGFIEHHFLFCYYIVTQ